MERALHVLPRINKEGHKGYMIEEAVKGAWTLMIWKSSPAAAAGGQEIRVFYT